MLAEIILLAKNSRLYLYQEKNCWPWHIYRNGDRKNMQPVGVRSKLSMRIRKWNNGKNDINIFEIITNKATLSWPPSVHKNRTKTPTNQTSHIPASISIPVNTPKTIKTCFFLPIALFIKSLIYQNSYIPVSTALIRHIQETNMYNDPGMKVVFHAKWWGIYRDKR